MKRLSKSLRHPTARFRSCKKQNPGLRLTKMLCRALGVEKVPRNTCRFCRAFALGKKKKEPANENRVDNNKRTKTRLSQPASRHSQTLYHEKSDTHPRPTLHQLFRLQRGSRRKTDHTSTCIVICCFGLSFISVLVCLQRVLVDFRWLL